MYWFSYLLLKEKVALVSILVFFWFGLIYFMGGEW
jgi:hypothetical protein